MKNRIFIIHFQPLEKYPPVINLIRFLQKQNKANTEIHVISTKASFQKKPFEIDDIVIHRIARMRNELGKMQRMFLYLRFNFASFFLLLKYRPSKILYYETLSAGAAAIYKKWIRKKTELFIHYHEYSSIAEYQNGMVLGRWLHKLEQGLYAKSRWVSHTNTQRMELFKKDIGNDLEGKAYILPNYPPEKWINNTAVASGNNSRIGFVYVGALSLETMYVREFAEFILQQPNTCYLDIYSDNFTSDISLYFQNLGASNINFKGAVEYDDLPEILRSYQVGVILYKGHIPNYIYNAPNKLFEYLACGLDVWFPDVMTGSMPYLTSDTFPMVRSFNFNRLNVINPEQVIDKTGLILKSSGYYYEQNLNFLTEKLLATERA